MSQVEVVDLNGTLVYVTCNCFDMTYFFWGKLLSLVMHVK